jgi:hypothetical protein
MTTVHPSESSLWRESSHEVTRRGLVTAYLDGRSLPGAAIFRIATEPHPTQLRLTRHPG